MTVHAAITTSGVMNVVSTISGSEMPSTPRWYQALNAPIHGSRSTNCIAAVPRSKSLHSTTLSTNVATDASSASQRPNAARSSPSSNSSTPAATGSQISVLRMGQSRGMGQLRSSSQASSADRPMIVANA